MQRPLAGISNHPNAPVSDHPSRTDEEEVSSGRIYDLLFIASLIVFLAAWIIIDLGKFYSLHSYVFDLGYIMERLWQPYNVVSLPSYEFIFFNSAFQLVLSPLYFLHSFQILLILQVVSFGASSIPLYALGKMKVKSKFIALLISTSFLIYFPSSGILWFDFHIQAFFIPLFIFGYYFHVKEKYLVSSLLFILSGTVRFPYSVFPILFSFYDLLEIIYSRKLQNIGGRRLFSDLAVFFASGFILVGGYFFILSGHNSTAISFMHTPLAIRLLMTAATLLAIAGPVLFLPATKFRWLLLFLPFIMLGLYTGSYNYFFPRVYQLQYTSMAIPPLFLGLIDALGANTGRAHNNPIWRLSVLRLALHAVQRFRTDVKRNSKKMAVSIFSILILGSILFQPYGPLNNFTPTAYGISNSVNFNTSNYKALSDLTALIPKNNPNVMFQNDMPEMLPRPELNNTYFLFSIYVSSNVTLSEVKNNTFPLDSAAPVYPAVKHVNVDYLIAFTQSSQYYLQFGKNEATLPQLVSLMMLSGKYGIVAEEYGFVILERNYHSQPKIFKPYGEALPFGNDLPSTFGNVTSPALSNSYVSLVPGTYNITYGLSASNNSNGYHIAVGLNYDLNLTDTVNVSGSFFRFTNNITYVSFNIALPGGAYYARPLISENRTLGDISVYKVYIQQKGY